MNRRLTLDVTPYYIDWSDIQLRQGRPDGFAYAINAGKARNMGVEVAVHAAPTPSLSLDGAFGYLDATLREDIVNNFGGQTLVKAGTTLPMAAKWNAMASATYAWKSSLAPSVTASYRYVGSAPADLAATGTVRELLALRPPRAPLGARHPVGGIRGEPDGQAGRHDRVVRLLAELRGLRPAADDRRPADLRPEVETNDGAAGERRPLTRIEIRRESDGTCDGRDSVFPDDANGRGGRGPAFGPPGRRPGALRRRGEWQWLEPPHDARALAWVTAHNDASAKALQALPGYAALRDELATKLKVERSTMDSTRPSPGRARSGSSGTSPAPSACCRRRRGTPTGPPASGRPSSTSARSRRPRERRSSSSGTGTPAASGRSTTAASSGSPTRGPTRPR